MIIPAASSSFWDGAFLLRHAQYLRRRDVEELSVPINEALDQPRASESIDLRAFARNPLHVRAFANDLYKSSKSAHARSIRSSSRPWFAAMPSSISLMPAASGR